MTDPLLEQASKRFRIAIELHEAGVAMKRAQLRRQHPELDEPGIARLLGAWLRERPGAERGDVADGPDVQGARRSG